MSRRIVVPLRPFSDGDPSHKPTNPAMKQVDPPTIYLEKLADEWMKTRDEAKPGCSYILRALPHGYTLWEKTRGGTSKKHVDRWLYGHPEGKSFDSPNRYFPHFLHLMENGSSMGCPCSVCTKSGQPHCAASKSSKRSGSIISSRSASTNPSLSNALASNHQPVQLGGPVPIAPHHQTAQSSDLAPAASYSNALPTAPLPKGRPKMIPPGMDTSRVDEEGTPDVWRNLIDKLKRHITVDQPIDEPLSMDWRAEQRLVPDLLHRSAKEPQCMPRVGEIVLYLRNANNRQVKVIKEDSGEYMLHDVATDTRLEPALWAAGLVTQVPESDGNDQDEISDTISGVRVEPIPNPNDTNKSLSKRYKYVPTRYTRPFFGWKHYLSHLPDDEWHPTVRNALTCMSTMSLVSRYRFQGEWPKASVWCHGIYVGSELFVVGDTVRMSPKAGYPKCTDIMVIKSIRLKMSNLQHASNNDYDDGSPYNSEAWIYGTAYTMDPSRSNKLYLDHTNATTPRAADGYSITWHPLHPSNKEIAVPFSRIMSRLYESDAMHDYFSAAYIDQGREWIQEGRKFARENDNRILKSPGTTWCWLDTRSQALDLETVNGLEVGIHDNERDLKDLRQKAKILEGIVAPNQEPKTATRDLRQFMAPAGFEEMPVRKKPALPIVPELLGVGQKRKHVVDVSDDENEEQDDEDEDEDEFRQHTIVLDDDGPSSPHEDGVTGHRLHVQQPSKRLKVLVQPSERE
ncbi:unnamed protein product [Periconia digitata]|uniref:Uncharacterized protein n=1 Tax=Periconia digitata TaxID=1303443 RepID=A0A9W4XE65_9PLEO|nr:unnamed protein product [Periconia digitata]